MQANTRRLLPKPEEASREHSERLAADIRQNIKAAGGSIGFGDYMQHALYAPGMGYYVAGTSKFGEAGDFTTAPEISPIFGAVIARQCREVLEQVPESNLLELGAGSGILAVTILKALERLNSLPGEYLILEVSAELRERQRERLVSELPNLVGKVRWLDDLPTEFHGVIVANEVADALPVEIFEKSGSEILQRRVAAAGTGFAWCSDKSPEVLRSAVEKVEAELGYALPDGYISEICLALPGWIADVAASLAQGVFLLIDYGLPRYQYYAPDRRTGWLRCHFRHFAHSDPLINVGIQDLTTWVDFTAIAEAAVDAGLNVGGYMTQGQFLMGGGLQKELTGFTDLGPEEQIELSKQVKLLTLPGEMGENFKCIALSRGDIAAPSAFLSGDRAHTL
jgi:SAM-dependent MidA family methyltransferase